MTTGAETVIYTRYYDGNYEKEINATGTKEFYYISGPVGIIAVYIVTNGSGQLYYTLTDHLGSIVALMDETGTIVEETSFGPWGRTRNPNTWHYDNTAGLSLIFRGFTDHEMLPEFGLINMNGRLYDPALGRFLSPDNHVQNSNNPQNYNRYSYCLNNPLVYTDPDGEFLFPVIIGAIIGAYIGGTVANNDYNPENWDYSSGKTWGYMAGGTIIGGFSGFLGSEIAMAGEPFAFTTSMATSSYFNSMGMFMLTNGRTEMSISFGLVSYNATQNEWGRIGKKHNKWYEDLGYGLGAFSNLTDIWAGIKGAYNSNSSLELQTNWHSQTYDPETNSTFSWGAMTENGERYFPEDASFWKRLPFATKRLNPVVNYHSPCEFRTVVINRVNKVSYYKYISQLPKTGQFYRWASLVPIKGMHCTIAASRALLAGGVFNIPILRMPWLLDLQMRIRDYTYLSPYLNFQY